ncbi:MAG: Protein-tyrosine-phosphatase [Succiniclasticum sp.]|jgi:protein-tyrosine phosphatase
MIDIELEKQPNTRDLGGTVTEDGRVVRPHKLLRSGRLTHLTRDDASTLLGPCRVRTVVDLRSALEAEQNPDPQWGIVEHYHLPMLNDDQLGFSGVSGTDSREPQGILDTLVDQTLQPGYSAAQYMIDVYQQLIASKQSQHSLRRFFDVLLTHQDGAVLYHCNGGKDRTGILTALVLTALGVPWNTVALDYMGTNERVKKNLERRLHNLPDRHQNPHSHDVVRAMYLADASYLEAARSEMIKLGGSPKGYLQTVLGLSDVMLAELQDRYLKKKM